MGAAHVTSRSWFFPLAVYNATDGAEWLVRDYAGQSGRFCVIGPHTIDILASFKTLKEAKAFVVERSAPGEWENIKPTERIG